jgi:hypothetical protein
MAVRLSALRAQWNTHERKINVNREVEEFQNKLL